MNEKIKFGRQSGLVVGANLTHDWKVVGSNLVSSKILEN